MASKGPSPVDLLQKHPKSLVLSGSLLFGLAIAVRSALLGDRRGFLVEVGSWVVMWLVMLVLIGGLLRWVAWRDARKEKPASHGGRAGGDRPSG